MTWEQLHTFSLLWYLKVDQHKEAHKILLTQEVSGNQGQIGSFLSNDRIQFIRLANFIANMHNQASFEIRGRAMDANKKAIDLINLIKEKYQLQ